MFQILQILAELKARQELLKILPPEEAQRLRDELKQEVNEAKEHRKKLEIAEAGRPRNFWGK